MNKYFKIGYFTAIIMATILSTSCAKTNTGDITTTPTPEEVKATLYTADITNYIASKADEVIVGEPPVKSWWSHWGRYGNAGWASGIDEISADAATSGVSLHDASNGEYFRVNLFKDGIKEIAQFKGLGLHDQACIEGFGDSRNIILAIHKNDDGSFIWDDTINGAKLYAMNWGWETKGPLANPDANYVVWSGMPSFVNSAPWQGKYVIGNYPEIEIPTYPNGKSALGYQDNEELPHKANLWKACAALDLNGNYLEDSFVLISDEKTEDYTRQPIKMPDGSTKYAIGDFAIGKDEAAPFWLQYARTMVRDYISKGTEGFWVDNYLGWNSLGNSPLSKSFGEWSKYRFATEYLPKHPELGIKNPKKFDIAKYVKDKYKEWYPDGDVKDLSWNNVGWRDVRWTEDDIWRAYLAYKSESIQNAQTEFYTIVKEEATKLGIDPNTIAVTGNDFAYMQSGIDTSKIIDVISNEYNPKYHVLTGFNYDGYPPQGRMGGLLTMLPKTSVSNHSSIWYYAEQEPASYMTGKVIGYEALAYNQTVNSGENMYNGIGTKRSAGDVNTSIGKLRDIFDNRTPYAEIGIYYSTSSEYVQLAPSAYVNGDSITATVGYMGWAYALEQIHVPFRCVTEFDIADEIGSLSVLIMPGTRSIPDDYIEKYLRPFLDNGGVLIVTGEKAGLYSSRDNAYRQNKTNTLEEFVKAYDGKGNAYFEEIDVAQQIYTTHKDDTVAQTLEKMKSILEDLKTGYDENVIHKILEITGFNENTLTTVNYDKYTGNFFVDLVNMALTDVNAKEMPKISGQIKVRLPKILFNSPFTVSIFNNNEKKIVPAKNVVIEGGYAIVDVPEFEVYSTVIFERIKE